MSFPVQSYTPTVPAATDHLSQAASEGGSPFGTPSKFARQWSAIKRFKWLILLILVSGSTLGVLASKLTKPVYSVTAKLWIAAEEARRVQSGPVRGRELVAASGWIELLKSTSLTEGVVRKLKLFVTPKEHADSVYFQNFDVSPAVMAANYRLQVSPTGQTYTLYLKKNVIERGQVGDSIGRKLGWVWRPATLPASRDIEFRVVSVNEAAKDLLLHMRPSMPDASSFLLLQYAGDNPVKLADALNLWIQEYLKLTVKLKKQNGSEFVMILDNQLRLANAELQAAESRLETFRITTIGLPGEGGTPLAAGLEQTRDPVFQDFFRTKVEHETVKRDVAAIEKVLAEMPADGMNSEALLVVPGLLNGNTSLNVVIAELAEKEGKLRTARQEFTDEYFTVRDLKQSVATLKKVTLPSIVRSSLAQMKDRETQLAQRIDAAGSELKKIPPRTIEEMRLRRDVTVADNLYSSLLAKFSEAKLADASSTPDVSILDPAVAPRLPSSNPAPKVIAVAIVGSLAAAILLALLLDHMDSRLRYPEQVARELGLDLIGFYPRMRPKKKGKMDPMTAARAVEAIRSLRLALGQLRTANGGLALTVSSPSQGDGKSLVTSNLALSFAEAGYRTVLIDADMRRGHLHKSFGLAKGRGLIEYLTNTSMQLSDVVQATGFPNLWVLTTGNSAARGAKLLASQRLLELLASAKEQFDIVLIDTPPLGAAADALTLGVATGQMLIVLRAGVTNRKIAEAKLQVADRVPVRLVGAVLNDVRAEGVFEYYSYTPYEEDGATPDDQVYDKPLLTGVT